MLGALWERFGAKQRVIDFWWVNHMNNSERKLYYLSFTDRGGRLAEKLASVFGGEVCSSRAAGGVQKWTEQHFSEAEGLVYVGAAGIAVRAIAPFIKSKTTDPAVIVIDEGGSFIIPILSGHLGGANKLARELAAVTGGMPVITTATDVSGRFAVDEWAKKQGCRILNPKRIVHVSSRILEGKEIRIRSDWPVDGRPPELVQLVLSRYAASQNILRKDPGEPAAVSETQASESCVGENADVVLSIRRYQKTCLKSENSLLVVPQIVVLGVGCRKGTEAAHLEECFRHFTEESGIEEAAFCAAASIDLKKDEPGLLDFCRRRGLPFCVFSSGELLAVPGTFSSSGFVREITGVDNVCERSAVRASGGGRLLVRKTKYEGVTMAAALKDFRPDWRL